MGDDKQRPTREHARGVIRLLDCYATKDAQERVLLGFLIEAFEDGARSVEPKK